ncbi:MAG: Crp/Fnr family transcriptional regulator [Treponema sp.]|jgi:CRP-like cAMP-binding protein|nr:Crp/Fnr family transcriptional regulator [Treponema sp.]
MPDKPLLSFVSYKQGSFIVLEGKQNADRFFIVKQGRVMLSKEVELVAEDKLLKEGDFFGVVSSMSGHRYIETAQALTDVVLIAVSKDQYPWLIQNNAPIAMKIIRQFSRRMRLLDKALTTQIFKLDAQDSASQIYDVAEYYMRQGQYNIAFYAYHQYIKGAILDEHVASARERMLKLAPRVKGVQFERNFTESVRNYARNTMIFSEGETGHDLYIIQKGSVKIVKIAQAQEVLLAVLQAGDIFGEMALLESKPRTASAIAFEDVTLMTVNRQNFEDLTATQPQLVARLTMLLSDRIWFGYKQLANAHIIDPLGRLYDQLLIQLEKDGITRGERQSYIFNFGPKELANMIGIPKQEGINLMKRLMASIRITAEENRLCVSDIREIFKKAEFYHKANRIGRALP